VVLILAKGITPPSVFGLDKHISQSRLRTAQTISAKHPTFVV